MRNRGILKTKNVVPIIHMKTFTEVLFETVRLHIHSEQFIDKAMGLPLVHPSSHTLG